MNELDTRMRAKRGPHYLFADPERAFLTRFGDAPAGVQAWARRHVSRTAHVGDALLLDPDPEAIEWFGAGARDAMLERAAAYGVSDARTLVERVIRSGSSVPYEPLPGVPTSPPVPTAPQDPYRSRGFWRPGAPQYGSGSLHPFKSSYERN